MTFIPLNVHVKTFQVNLDFNYYKNLVRVLFWYNKEYAINGLGQQQSRLKLAMTQKVIVRQSVFILRCA